MLRRGSINGSSASSSRVRVAVRVRPPDYKLPRDETLPPCVTTTPTTVEYHHEIQTKNYTYDHVFDPAASQEDVYAGSLQPLMAPFLDGFNVTVMAYGQTGSGKTHTMGSKATVINTTPTTSPSRSRSSSLQMPSIAVGNTYRGAPEDGLVPRFLNELFSNLKREPSVRTVRVTFVEIYCDTIRDLLDDRVDKNIVIREDAHNVVLENVRSLEVESLSKALELWNQGRSRQATGPTAMNDESSRSHAVYTMEVSRKFRSEIKKSKLTFVDLAGSERLKKTQVEGVRKRESIQINVGLSALGNVINALADAKAAQRRNSVDASMSRSSSQEAFVPYRTSKLTRLLQDALGGNSRTLFVACVSPLDSNAEETLCTLQYANRARSIQNKAEKNAVDHHEPLVLAAIHPVSPEVIEVARLQDEVSVLRQQIVDLEAAARAKTEELALAEQTRAEKKEKKRNDRRDVEVTTEINIVPYQDAQTQFEREHEPAAPTTSETGTETEQPADRADFATQSGVSFSDTRDADMETDVEPPMVTADAYTESAVEVVDCNIQSDLSLFDRHDVDTGTDAPLPLEMTDASTDPEAEAPKTVSVDVETQVDAPVRSVHDSEANTEPVSVIVMADASTEPDLERSRVASSDFEIQFGVPLSHFRDVDVATEPEVLRETTDTSTCCEPTITTTEDACCQTSRPSSPETSPVRPLRQATRMECAEEVFMLVEASNWIVQLALDVSSSTVTENQPATITETNDQGPTACNCKQELPNGGDTEQDQASTLSPDCDIATESSTSLSLTSVDLVPQPTVTWSEGAQEVQAEETQDLTEPTKLVDENPTIVEAVATSSKSDESISTVLEDSLKHRAPAFISFNNPQTILVASSELEISAFEQPGQAISSVKKGRPESLAPESLEEELTSSSCSLSENQLEVVRATEEAPCQFVSDPNPAKEDLLNEIVPVTRNISETSCEDTFAFILPGEFDDDDDFLLPDSELFEDSPLVVDSPCPSQSLPSTLSVSVKEPWVLSSARPAIDVSSCGVIEEIQTHDSTKIEKPSPNEPAADFRVSRSPRRATPSQSASLGSLTARQAVTIRPLRMFAFDDEIATTPSKKATAQAKALYTGIRELVQDEFGSQRSGGDDDAGDISADCAVGQLLTETKTLIKRRRQQQQRIALLRRRVLALEELLVIEHRAPIAEADLQAYSKRVQEEFLTKLLLQLESLAAQRLHARLTARLEAERTTPSVMLDGDASRSPFLSVTQCQACAEWYFHRPEDLELFAKTIMPLISSGYITLTPRELEAEHSWFQL